MDIIITGNTATGKNYICNYIIDYVRNMGISIQQVVTDTTRPPREGEIQGITYNFVSDTIFLDNLHVGKYIEYQAYEVVGGDVWYYGTNIESFKNDCNICILDKFGAVKVRDYLKNNGRDAIIIYLNAFDEASMMYYSLNRLGDTVTKKQIDEAWRRYRKDKEKYEDIHNYDVIPVPQFYDERTEELIRRVVDEWVEQREKKGQKN